MAQEIPTSISIQNFLPAPTTELPNLPIGNEDFTSGQLIIASGVDNTFKNGMIIKDLGYVKVGDTLETGKSVTGLYHFIQSPTVNKVLATINDATGANLVLKYNNNGTWTVINTGTTFNGFEDAKTEFESFIGYCFIVGYDSTDNVFLPVGSLTGTTFSTSTNVTDMPQAKFIKRYGDRLYIANCYYSGAAHPYRVYKSSIVTAGAITWTPSSDFFDVDYSDQITGIYEAWDKLIMFTQFKTYYYDRFSDTKRKLYNKGCINNRTIQAWDQYLIWADKDNIWLAQGFGAKPEGIGNKILQLIRTSDPSKWTSEIVDDEYNIYLGECSANGLTYSNCLATFNFRTLSWRWRELYDNVTVLTKYSSSDDDYLYMGTTGGEVMRKGKRNDTTMLYSDNGKAINSHFRLQAIDFNEPSVQKTIQKLEFYSESCSGVTIRGRIIDKDQSEFKEFQSIGQIVNLIQEMPTSLQGKFIQIEGVEKSVNKSWIIDGFNLLVSGITVNQ